MPAGLFAVAAALAVATAAAAMAPDATLHPFMSTGATDGAALRSIGIPTYGLLVRSEQLVGTPPPLPPVAFVQRPPARVPDSPPANPRR